MLARKPTNLNQPICGRCVLGIGTSSTSGMAAACMTNTNALSSPPSNKQPASQVLAKGRINNASDTETRDSAGNSLATPNKPQPANALQKSPSDSVSSKNDTEKSRSTKSRNKEGKKKTDRPLHLSVRAHFWFWWRIPFVEVSHVSTIQRHFGGDRIDLHGFQ